jgi:hypothetical protein
MEPEYEVSKQPDVLEASKTEHAPEASNDRSDPQPEEDFDPREKIDEFPWADLQGRYEADMATRDKVEQELFDEFGSLMEVTKTYAILEQVYL